MPPNLFLCFTVHTHIIIPDAFRYFKDYHEEEKRKEKKTAFLTDLEAEIEKTSAALSTHPPIK